MQPLRGWTEEERRAQVAATEAALAHHLAAVPTAPTAAVKRSGVRA